MSCQNCFKEHISVQLQTNPRCESSWWVNITSRALPSFYPRNFLLSFDIDIFRLIILYHQRSPYNFLVAWYLQTKMSLPVRKKIIYFKDDVTTLGYWVINLSCWIKRIRIILSQLKVFWWLFGFKFTNGGRGLRTRIILKNQPLKHKEFGGTGSSKF